jgi:hypothetical protein
VQQRQQRHHQYIPDKTDMHAQAAVYASTGKAYVHSIGHRGPGRVLCGAIKADLHSSTDCEHTCYEREVQLKGGSTQADLVFRL